jgi:hypothetical protein
VFEGKSYHQASTGRWRTLAVHSTWRVPKAWKQQSERARVAAAVFLENNTPMKFHSSMVYLISFFMKMASCCPFNQRLRRSRVGVFFLQLRKDLFIIIWKSANFCADNLCVQPPVQRAGRAPAEASSFSGPNLRWQTSWSEETLPKPPMTDPVVPKPPMTDPVVLLGVSSCDVGVVFSRWRPSPSLPPPVALY